MSLSESLRSQCADVWEACFAHPFVQAIGRGDLDESKFKRFLVQDYLFLIDYARVLAYGSAKTSDLESQTWFAKLLAATLDTEMESHRRTCAEWGIGAEELEGAEPLPTTVAYTSFLVRTASSSDIAGLAAALLPCQWGYADIGTRLLAQGLPDEERYAAWIRAYADPDYVGLTDWLRTFVDSLEGGPGSIERLTTIFRTTLRYELAFWEMAWSDEHWPAQAR